MSITLLQLLNKANEGYGDSTLFMLYNRETGKPLPARIQIKRGDGLAMFVVNELASTCSEGGTDEEIITEALRVMDEAITDLVLTQQAIGTLGKG